jgi:predicted membrane protein
VPASRLAASPAARPAFPTADDHLPTQESIRAIFSSNQRAGRWEPADEIQARAICGEVTLDFTRAELPPRGMIEIEAWAICGEVRIIVPDGAEIELEGEPVLGSIEQVRRRGAREAIREWVAGERDENRPATREPPYFRIDARAILGSIKVVTGR